MLLLVITAKESWLTLHWLYWICLYDPSKLIHTLSEQRKRWRSEEKSERKQSRLRIFKVYVEYCCCHPVVIQHDKMKRECCYTLAQKRKQRCHIQNRKQKSRYDLARLFNPFPKKPNTKRSQRCWLVYYVSP